MAQFKVFHLKDEVDKSFFLKPRPRFDQTIADTYCITKEQAIKTENNRIANEQSVEHYMSNMVVSCHALWDIDSYIHVANVKAKDIVQVLRNTNNINGHWFLTKSKGVEVETGETQRATCNGDLIEQVVSGDLYMVFGFTFLNIKTGLLIE
jgi:hypothetical protein